MINELIKINNRPIVFISFEPLTERYVERYCLDYLVEREYKIYYFDISRLFFKNLKMNEIKRKYAIIIHSYEELYQLYDLYELGNCITVCNLGFSSFNNLKIFRLLESKGSILIYFDDGRLPFVKNDMILRILHVLRQPKILKRKMKNLLHKDDYLKFDYVFTSGRMSRLIFKTYNTFHFNNLDYNRFLKHNNLTGLEHSNEEKYFIFIDQNIPDHPDLKMLRLNRVNRNLYYSKLNKFIEILEKQFNFNAVIAAHPTADYTANPFNNREVIVGDKIVRKTKSCQFVVTFYSTAINYAILNYKPLIFITSKTVSSVLPKAKKYSSFFAKELKQTLINIDNIKQKTIRFKNQVDTFLYDQYKYNYIVSKESENQFNEELIEQALEEIQQKTK